MLDISGTLPTLRGARRLAQALGWMLLGVLCFNLSVPNALAADGISTYTLKLYAHSHLLTTEEMRCIDALYTHESHWNPKAVNKASGAYGIPQGMSTWLRTATPFEQIMWGIKYCFHRYGSMCGALNHWKAKGWH